MSGAGLLSGSRARTALALAAFGPAKRSAELRDLGRKGVEPRRLRERSALHLPAAREGEVEPELPVVSVLLDCPGQTRLSGAQIALRELGLAKRLPRLRRPRCPARGLP